MDLDMALTLINSVDNNAYTMAKYRLEDMRKFTFSCTKKCLKLVKQRIKNESTQGGETANKTGGKRKDKKTTVFLLWQTWSQQDKVL